MDHNASLGFKKQWRSEGKIKDFLVMGIKDQKMIGKVYFSGELISDPAFIASMDAVLN